MALYSHFAFPGALRFFPPTLFPILAPILKRRAVARRPGGAGARQRGGGGGGGRRAGAASFLLFSSLSFSRVACDRQRGGGGGGGRRAGFPFFHFFMFTIYRWRKRRWPLCAAFFSFLYACCCAAAPALQRAPLTPSPPLFPPPPAKTDGPRLRRGAQRGVILRGAAIGLLRSLEKTGALW